MKLSAESVKKILETVEAYARWSEALRLGCAEKANAHKQVWVDRLNDLTVDEFIMYLEADI